MSRATRPLRQVGPAAREGLAAVVARAAAIDITRSLRVGPESAARWWLRRAAAALACRPAQLRRCLLGRPVSARAAKRILGA